MPQILAIKKRIRDETTQFGSYSTSHPAGISVAWGAIYRKLSAPQLMSSTLLSREYFRFLENRVKVVKFSDTRVEDSSCKEEVPTKLFMFSIWGLWTIFSFYFRLLNIYQVNEKNPKILGRLIAIYQINFMIEAFPFRFYLPRICSDEVITTQTSLWVQ